MAGLRTLAAWVAFLGCLFAGAGLLLSDAASMQAAGLALLLAPLAVLVFLTLAHYARERRRSPPAP